MLASLRALQCPGAARGRPAPTWASCQAGCLLACMLACLLAFEGGVVRRLCRQSTPSCCTLRTRSQGNGAACLGRWSWAWAKHWWATTPARRSVSAPAQVLARLLVISCCAPALCIWVLATSHADKAWPKGLLQGLFWQDPASDLSQMLLLLGERMLACHQKFLP